MKTTIFNAIPIVLRELSDKSYDGELDDFNLGILREAVIAHLLKEGIDVCDGGKLWNEFVAIWNDPAVEKVVCDWLDEEYELL